MKKHPLIFSLFFSALIAQSNTSLESVRKIRLENLKHNYKNKTIRFYIPGKISVKGELLNVTDKNFILSENNKPSTYSHETVNYVFIDPNYKDLIMVFSMSALGGISSYMALLIIKKNPDPPMKGVTASVSTIITGLFARTAFYKPIKIDISGETNI